MHAFSSRWVGRSFFFVLPLCAAAYAAGCSDEDPVTPGPTNDASPDTNPNTPTDSGGGGDVDAALPKRDCTEDGGFSEGLYEHLECTGLYSSFGAKTIAAEVKPYKPANEFWSDGAEKSRFVLLPTGQKIDISDWDEWTFPVGTKVWKEFKLGGKRIETRLFEKTAPATWVHTAYRWNADETDAVRKDVGEKIPGIGPDGGIYEIPSSDKCDQCHFGRKDQMLGFDAVSLGLPEATGETLATLAAAGRFSIAPPKTELQLPAGGGVGADSNKAVGWIHANCGSCHNGNSNAAASFRAHFLLKASQLADPESGAAATLEQLDVYTQGHCKPTARLNEDAGTPYNYIQGGDPSRSLMSILSGRRSPAGEEPNAAVQMPPIVTHAVDTAGHTLLDTWITALPACP